MSGHVNFLGIPVEGRITPGHQRVKQRPLSDLEPLLRAVLDDSSIKAFGWMQYTPYFNDGDPCVFEVCSPWFLTVDDPDPDDVEDPYEYEVHARRGHPSIGAWKYSGNWPNRVPIPGSYVGPDVDRFERVKALADALDSCAFEDVLLEAFGDHAKVTIRSSGITVDFYSHD
ncbi:hypothetical protein [Actinoplanes regularis]|uniref:Uncharacterized protein n=1 Tax=Actinoplanes regularis TaxID=52697 RepID=A0A238ZVA5_9ACTN|nr:hypothetical protein [Actinoplanes regularis]GIE90270.1 hypothetical protein Are01nite_67500 [Actinoplanes regularis]SNR86714.1 hypothetical protein SAMN06264365_106299 [Actinoplanes regularis]